jgi:DNA-directed RNA polymerase subunit RPC12/RpoP
MASRNIKLKVIPEPAPKSRVVTEPHSGEDDGEEGDNANRVNYLCGNCNSIIAKNVIEGSMKEQVVRCNVCNSYNEFA